MEITNADFEMLFGGSLSRQAREVVRYSDFSYRTLSREERDAAIQRYVAFLITEKRKSGPAYHEVWEAGWKENLEEFLATGSETALIPKFVKRDQAVRFRGDLVWPGDSEFETNFVKVLRDYFFRTYFEGFASIVEFGCGTGTNLVHLSKIYPRARLLGSDWAPSSIQLVDQIRSKLGIPVEGVLLDLFSPKDEENGTWVEADGAYTMGAMEQLGDNFWPFLNYLLDSKITRVVHFETAYELYSADTLWGFLARAYIEKRNWLRGYFAALWELQGEGKIRILHQGETFGSFFHDGYTVTVWEKT